MTLFTTRIIAFTTRWGAACDWNCTVKEREREREEEGEVTQLFALATRFLPSRFAFRLGKFP